MAELNKDLKIANIVVHGYLGYELDMTRMKLDRGDKPEDFIKNTCPLDNNILVDGVKIGVFSSGKVRLYGNSIEQINARYEKLRLITEKYKVV